MSKYHNLTEHLASRGQGKWRVGFEEIERILGCPLPKSAYQHPAWWSNQVADGHSQNAAWKAVGWRTGELDLRTHMVTFSHDGTTTKPSEETIKELDGSDRANGNTPYFPRHANVQPAPIRTGGLTMAEAKAGLSTYFGVPQESIEITIKG